VKGMLRFESLRREGVARPEQALKPLIIIDADRSG
jgi:hypothetical protein